MDLHELVKELGAMHISHEYFLRTYDKVRTLASFALPGSVVLLVGPSQVGKTRLLSLFRDEMSASSDVGGGRMPSVLVEAANAVGGKFSTKHFTMRALEELKHPMSFPNDTLARVGASETTLRLQLERAIIMRGVSWMLVDEGHHMLKGIGKADVLDSLKCLGNTTGAVIVVCGGYELLERCFASAHMSAREYYVEFPNYGRTEASFQEFDRILATLDGRLPWKGDGSLLTMREFIYEATFGCVGLLFRLIVAALANSSTAHGSRLRKVDFESVRDVRQMASIERDIKRGMELLEPLRFGMSGQPNDEKHGERAEAAKKKRREPFRRKLGRDACP